MSIFSIFKRNKIVSNIKHLSVKDVYDLYKNKNDDYVFIDIREKFEWKEGVIPGVKKISMGNLIGQLKLMDKSLNYVIICRSGSRSNQISKKMESLGFLNVHNFKGGMLNWYSNNYPTE